jgi:Phosphodiesterase/alkaline phosphatase D
LPDGAVLWTRLAPKPLKGGGMPEMNVPVDWMVSEDESMRRIVRRGTAMATPALAHSVHVEVGGLAPGRWYWYQFRTGSEISPIGRFRTAPALGADVEAIRFAFASCQSYTYGYYTAYQHMSEENLDFVLHLGDYIYEKSYAGKTRQHLVPEVFTLAEYRNQYALYKSDPLLQKAHAAFPFITTWDDHEVSNNYADFRHERDMPKEEFLKRREAAYQAYYEHLPLRRASLPSGPNMRLYRRLDFGRLLRLHVLDTRQYRTDQPCGDGQKPACDEVRVPGQTMLGSAQEKWLENGLMNSKALWNALGQQVMFTHQDFDPGDGERYNMDSWSGYHLARERVVEVLSRKPSLNPVILTGDVHSNWVGEVRTDIRNPESWCVATEFVGTSISSGGDGVDMRPGLEKVLSHNPQIRFFNGQRGYVRCEVTKKHWRADYRIVERVTEPGAPIRTRASFAVEVGNPIPQVVSNS